MAAQGWVWVALEGPRFAAEAFVSGLGPDALPSDIGTITIVAAHDPGPSPRRPSTWLDGHVWLTFDPHTDDGVPLDLALDWVERHVGAARALGSESVVVHVHPRASAQLNGEVSRTQIARLAMLGAPLLITMHISESD